MPFDHRRSAAAVLRSLDPPIWHERHSRAVAEVAAWLAGRALGRGLAVDRARVESAALLHDVDKLLPPGDPARALPHGEGSAVWLADHGLPELGPLVAGHPVTRLADQPWVDRWLSHGSLEGWLVAYADKRAGQRLEPMAARFDSWSRRYPDGWDRDTTERVRRNAERLEETVCRRLGVDPSEVRRIRWTRTAMATQDVASALTATAGAVRLTAGPAGATADLAAAGAVDADPSRSAAG
jgi:hypothetical protein